MPDSDAMRAVGVNISPGAEYNARTRPFQGIPGIERHSGGRLFAAWYSCRPSAVNAGGDGEGESNYILLALSDDDGVTWVDPALVIDPPEMIRAFDPCLWMDPLGRLWLFWAQSCGHWDGRGGVWAIRCDSPEAVKPTWSAPRRLCNGIMMNKPVVLHDGVWLLPASVWGRDSFREDMSGPRADMASERFSNVIASVDQGQTWSRRGGADVPGRTADEHMVVELRGGRLWMLVRTAYGIGQSFSGDGGATWSPGEDSGIKGPGTRFHLRRLKSGRLILVNHRVDPQRPRLRRDLYASLSEDEGRTWRGDLLIDGRDDVSYPDMTEGDNGLLYVCYDRNRLTDREILMAVFTEADILAGKLVSAGSRLRSLISKAARPGSATD